MQSIANQWGVAFIRPEPLPARPAAAMTPASSKSVSPTTSQSVHDAGQRVKRDVLIDASTREVILRVVNVRTGQVDHQLPDDALLRMRVYNRALADGGGSSQNGGKTDAEA